MPNLAVVCQVLGRQMLSAGITFKGCREQVIDVRGFGPRTRSACIGRGFGRGFVMRQFQVTQPSQDIVHPTCAKCGAPMWLTRIEPDQFAAPAHRRLVHGGS
jgi:hypothetical protein